MTVLVALLRGVNVGGRNRLPMAELRASLASLGLEGVATVLQSGNAVFRRPDGDPAGLAGAIERRLADDLGLDVAVLLRTPAELRKLARDNPFRPAEAEPATLHVAFLDRTPEPEAAARLDPGRSPPDAFALRGRELYLHYPNGAGRSRLTIDYLERTLGVRATARNWNTLGRLLTLTREP